MISLWLYVCLYWVLDWCDVVRDSCKCMWIKCHIYVQEWWHFVLQAWCTAIVRSPSHNILFNGILQMLIGHVVSKLPRLPRLCSKAQWCTRPHMEILLWSGSTASDHGYEHLSHETMKTIFCLLTKCPTMQTAQLTHRLPPPWAMVTQNCVSWKIRRYSTGTVCKYIQIHHTFIYTYILLPLCYPRFPIRI